MEMAKLFENFAAKMKMIHLFQRVVAGVVENEIENLVELARALKDNSNREFLSKSYHGFGFRSLQTGELVSYGSSALSLEEREYHARLCKNKQYQWLLAEAFEEFQDFLWKAYALIGSVDHDFWPLEDFGKIYSSELPNRRFEWFYDRAKRKELRHIIKVFRSKRPALANLERENALQRDLRIYLPLIECLRHVIVHRGGVVGDMEAFTKKVLETDGLYCNGNPDPLYRKIISIPFGSGDLSNTVVLLEMQSRDIPFLQHQRFELLTECLIAYAQAASLCLVPSRSE